MSFFFLDTGARIPNSAPGVSRAPATATRPVCSRTATAGAWATRTRPRTTRARAEPRVVDQEGGAPRGR